MSRRIKIEEQHRNREEQACIFKDFYILGQKFEVEEEREM